MKKIAVIFLVVFMVAGCASLQLSKEAKSELELALGDCGELYPSCQGGNQAACLKCLEIEYQFFTALDSSIDGTDPNYAGWVAWGTSTEQKNKINRVQIIADRAYHECLNGDPNFCKLAVELYTSLERVESASTGAE